MTVRPVHRQFGSKGRMAAEIVAAIPPDVKVWCELFCGTAAVTLSKARHSQEHLNDLNEDVVNLFRVLRHPADRAMLADLIAMTPYAEAEFRACWEREGVDPVERARRFLVRSWMAVGGKQGERSGWHAERCNPIASARCGAWARLPDRLETFAQRMSRVYLHCKPWQSMLAFVADREDALVYVDPPYPRGSIATRSIVYRCDMEPGEHRALAEALRAARSRVILSMAPGTVYDEVLADWTQRTVPVRGMRNTVKDERLFFNYEPPVVPRAMLFAFDEPEVVGT